MLHLHFYGNGGIAAEGIDNVDAGDVFTRCGILIGGIADGFEAAIFAGAVSCQSWVKGLPGCQLKSIAQSPYSSYLPSHTNDLRICDNGCGLWGP
jgi:hypothetical protein